MPKISVIIPAYNVEKYLARCLDSILNQTYRDYEIILINDGSRDKTEEIALDYQRKYPDIFTVKTVSNGGQGRARNIALDMAKGEYISFIDSDDFIKHDMYEKMIKLAEETDCDFVTCNYLYGEDPDGYSLVVPKVPVDQKDMFTDPEVSPCNKLFRASIFQDNHLRYPEGHFYEDITFFFMYIPYIHKISYIPEAFYHYVIHGNSSIHGKQDSRVKDIFPVMESMILFYKERGFYEEFRDEVELAYVKNLLCSNVGRICQIQDRKLRKEMLHKTLFEVKSHFPNYARNPYLKRGVKSFYMRHVAEWNIGICAFLMDKFNIHQK